MDAPAPAARLAFVDALRGVALLAMAVYHFAWDLRFVGFTTVDVTTDPGWRLFARLIAGTFLALVGVSLVLATRRGFDRGRFLRRLAMVAAAAAAITIVTRIAFPQGYIFFGILHAIVVSSVLALPFLRAPLAIVAAVAAFCLAAPALLSGPAFDAGPLVWLGLFTVPPRSNDFVPIFPWFGVVLAGIILARLGASRLPRWGPSPLAWAGRHSLAIYLVHQPVLFGLVSLAGWIAPPNMLGFQDSFLESCRAACVESALDAALCERTCGCVARESQAAGLWRGVLQNTLTEAERVRYFDIAAQCQSEPNVTIGP